MASGVEVAQEVIDLYNEMKTKKNKSYATFKISDDLKTIQVDSFLEVEKNADKTGSANEFYKYVADNCTLEPRYAVVDLEYLTKETKTKKQKLIFVSWCPDTAKIKKKMLHASSMDALKNILKIGNEVLQANELDEISEESMIGHASKFDRN